MKETKMELPSKREFGWTLKPTSSAETNLNQLQTGQLEATINHETIKNVSTDMIIWWFQNFPNITVKLLGKQYPAYHLWHPYDHISVQKVPDTKGPAIREDSNLKIHEAFQRKPEYELNEKTKVSYFKEDGFGLEVKKGPFVVGRLLHKFRDINGGLEYRSRLVAGVEKGVLRGFMNSKVLPKFMSQEKMQAWFTHNIEEVGCFENFLPALYERRSEGNLINLDE
jgi:DAPG hydrolase PhiG domain